jgi:hypothetical protein
MNSLIDEIIEKQFLDNNQNNSDLSLVDHNQNLDEEDIFLEYVNSKISIGSSKELSYGSKHRLQLLIPYIQNYIQIYKPKSFAIIISLADLVKSEYKLPTLCFAKNKTNNYGILIPNIDFFTGAIYQFFKEVDSFDIPYENKSNSSIFIGSSTGPFENNTRIRFCELCKNSNRYKAYIHNLCQNDKKLWIQKYSNIELYIHDSISIKDQLKNKILINIDGNTMCWSRLYWQMRSNSIPLYINKTTSEIQFFDYVDHSESYISCDIDDSLITIEKILNFKTEDITIINNLGKKYIQNLFNDYLNSPVEYLKYIINNTLNKILHND